jgi:transcription antitermination factor NusG
MERWYVAHSKPRNEELLWKQYCIRNIEAYYPCIETRTSHSHAGRVEPYFPGYLFVHADLEITGRSILQWIPGGIGLVAFGDEPAFVSECLIQAIRQRVESLRRPPMEKPVPLSKGDHVLIHDGIFKGYEGILDVQLSGTDRARVLLSLLGNRQMPVELPVSYIQRKMYQ